MVVGQNGIFKKATTAKEETKQQTILEAWNLLNAESTLYEQTGKEGLEEEKIKSKLEEAGITFGENSYPTWEEFKNGSIITVKNKEIKYSNLYIGEIIGKTRLPVDDYTTWLKCANIKQKYTIEQIINNEELLDILMNSENAVDYMIRSKSTIMPLLINSQTAMKQIGLSEYATTNLITDDDWRMAILSNKNGIQGLDNSNPTIVPKMTSNTEPKGQCFASTYDYVGPYGAFDNVESPYTYDGIGSHCWVSAYPGNISNQYLGYKFEQAVWVYKFQIQPFIQNTTGNFNKGPKDVKLQYSDDGITYYDATQNITVADNNSINTYIVNSNNKQKHCYWRLYICNSYSEHRVCINTLQFYGK